MEGELSQPKNIEFVEANFGFLSAFLQLVSNKKSSERDTSIVLIFIEAVLPNAFRGSTTSEYIVLQGDVPRWPLFLQGTA